MVGDVLGLDLTGARTLLCLGDNGFHQSAAQHAFRFDESGVCEQHIGAGHTPTAVVHHTVLLAAARGYTDGVLTSLGHGTLDRTALVTLLRGAGIEALVDIRRFPNSRHNPDVESGAIAEWARDAGLSYRWEPGLGGRRTLPAGTPPEDTWWRVRQFAAYAAYTRTAPFADAFGALVEQAERQPTAMMCSEAVWWRCHRRVVADVAVLGRSMPVCHLMHDGRLLPHSPSDGARMRPDGQIIWPA